MAQKRTGKPFLYKPKGDYGIVSCGVFQFTNIELKRTSSATPGACRDPEFAFSYFEVLSRIGVSCSFTRAGRMKTPLRNRNRN